MKNMNRNPLGKGGFKDRPNDINKSPVTKGTREAANKFKAWVFEIWEKHIDDFEDLVISDQKVATDFLKLAASLCPKEVELGGTGEGGAIIIKYPDDKKAGQSDDSN